MFALQTFQRCLQNSYPLLELVCAKDYTYSSGSDHNIQFNCFSSHCQRFFNSANICYSLLNVSELSKAKVALQTVCRHLQSSFVFIWAHLRHKTRSPFGLSEASGHSLACQKPEGGGFANVFCWPLRAILKLRQFFCHKQVLFELEQHQQ